MNRYRKILHIVILVSVLFAGCSQPQPEPTPKPTRIPTPKPVAEPTEEPEDIPADMMVFTTLEEFNTYLSTKSSTKDLAALGTLERYFLPTGIPDDYVLYKITAGIVDIGFWYMPREYLASREGILEGESLHKHFLFISGRGTNSLATIMDRHNKTAKDLINGRYHVSPYNSNLFFWEEDGELLSMYTPFEYTKGNVTPLFTTECYERGEDGTFALAP